MFDPNGDLIPDSHHEPVHRCHKELDSGEACACGYRKPFPKTAEAPESKVRSFRGPVDTVEAFNENLWVAAQIIGLPTGEKYAAFKFFDWMLAQIIANPDAYQGAYRRAA